MEANQHDLYFASKQGFSVQGPVLKWLSSHYLLQRSGSWVLPACAWRHGMHGRHVFAGRACGREEQAGLPGSVPVQLLVRSPAAEGSAAGATTAMYDGTILENTVVRSVAGRRGGRVCGRKEGCVVESCTVCTGRSSGSKQQGGHGTCSTPIECCMDFGSTPPQHASTEWLHSMGCMCGHA